MFSKQNLLATLGGTLFMFVFGYLIWGIATASFFEEHAAMEVMKGEDEMSLGLIFLANLFTVFAMSTIYGKWARGYHSASQGFQFGAWIGFMVGVGMGLLTMATAKIMDSTGHAVEAVLDIIFYGLIGLVIALIYKATAAKDSE